MTIYVNRNGQNIAASVLYNFKQVCNVIVLRLHKTFLSERDDLILLYDAYDKKWTEIFNTDQKEPLLFQQILTKLTDVLAEAEKNIDAIKTTKQNQNSAKKN